MESQIYQPDWVFEVSWEVCNKVGGIHTVLASKSPLLVEHLKQQYIVLGPDLDRENDPEFTPDENLFPEVVKTLSAKGIFVRTGRWKVIGEPIALLVDFHAIFDRKNEILGELWEKFGVDSIKGEWDYIEPVLFSYTCGMVIDEFVNHILLKGERAVAHFHEWMCGAGALYLRSHNPKVGTVFTTHATMMGRALAGNKYKLYSQLEDVAPNKMAESLHIEAKHSMEYTSANRADAFTTVSEITARECETFHNKKPDYITPNGFQPNAIAADKKTLKKKREAAREKLIKIAEAVTGESVDKDALILFKSGRYEFHNKGIDVFLDAVGRFKANPAGKTILAFVLIPGAHLDPFNVVQKRLEGDLNATNGEENHFLTHHLVDMTHDPIVNKIRTLGLDKTEGQQVNVVFAPVYLNGDDGVFNSTYYDLLTGADLGVFPSYYEPWGYTPLESIAAGVPTVTTTFAGFGNWVKDHHSLEVGKSVWIIEREEGNDAKTIDELEAVIRNYASRTDEEREKSAASARKLADQFKWDNFIEHYYEAWSRALQRVNERKFIFQQERFQERLHQISIIKDHDASQPQWRKLFVSPKIPLELEGLRELAWNLWTYWNRDARDLFRAIDPEGWETLKQNPVAILESVSYKHLNSLKRNKTFMEYYQSVLDRFNNYMEERSDCDEPHVGYLCMEYGLDPLIKLYSGGLGVLAGDYLKEASDSNTKMTAIGLMYRNGYFKQVLTESGDQTAEYKPQKFTYLPLIPVREANGDWLRIQVDFPGHQVHAKVWLIQVGAVNLYLLDTDVHENSEYDRSITSELYGGDWENRLKQEFLLGVGGIRLYKKLNISPQIYHLNEGHAAFAGIERIRFLVEENGMSFSEAVEVVRSCSLFTTHTPVPAGHDVFNEDYMRKYFGHYPDRLGITWDAFMALGRSNPSARDEPFSVSHLAMHLSQEVNGVSKIHGEVTRKIFSHIYPGYFPNEMPFGYVTNGAHYPTHTALEFNMPLSQSNKLEFFHHHMDKESWTLDMTDEQVWGIRKLLKSQLIHFLKDQLQKNLGQRHQSPRNVMQVIANIDENALVIGFARRFATYKRATLIFNDLDRLRRLLNQEGRPVILIFSGKAHPKDIPGQELIKRVVEVSRMPEFMGKVLFIEDYNMYVARYLVSGCDVWLNNPTRPLEASGTSGIKACFNGVLNLSVLDGWWDEGYVSGSGWALSKEKTYDYQNYQNELDAETIYSLIENEVIPEYFEMNDDNVPEKWVQRIRKTVQEIVPNFTMHRMLVDYTEQYYMPLYNRHEEMKANDYAKARDLAKWKLQIKDYWDDIEVLRMDVFDSNNDSLEAGEDFTAEITLLLNGLNPDYVGVEMVFTHRLKSNSEQIIHHIAELKQVSFENNRAVYQGGQSMDQSGVYEYGFRIYPKHPDLKYRQDMPLVRWV